MRYSQETHTYPKKGKVKYISYFCGSYARSGRSACSAHIIYLNPLSELVLDDIRHRAKRVLEDEDRVRRELLEQKAKQSDRQLKADKSTLKATEKRLAELEKLTQALYEDKVLGTVPEAVFKNLMVKYEAERVEKQLRNCRLSSQSAVPLFTVSCKERNFAGFRSAVASTVYPKRALTNGLTINEAGDILNNSKKLRYNYSYDIK